MLRAVIFDMDGVIQDSETISWETWRIAAGERGIVMTDEIQRLCMGSSRADIMVRLKEVYGSSFDSEGFLNRTSELFYQIEDKEGIPLMPYAREILVYLSSRYRLALASSTRYASVMRQMKNAGVIDFFETITTGDSVAHSKPDPEIYLKACSSLKLSPGECAAVEDSPNGIKSAYSAGLKAIMVPDKVQPDQELSKMCWRICGSLKELEGFL